jgi:heat shock protein HtpX
MSPFRAVTSRLGRLVGLYPFRQYVEPAPQIFLIAVLYLGIPWLTQVSTSAYNGHVYFWSVELLYPNFDYLYWSVMNFLNGRWLDYISRYPFFFFVPFVSILKMLGFIRAITLFPRFLAWKPRPQLTFPVDDGSSREPRLVDGGLRRSLSTTVGMLIIGSLVGVCLAGVLMFVSLISAAPIGFFLAPFTGGASLAFGFMGPLIAVTETLNAVAIGVFVVPLMGLIGGCIGGLGAAEGAIRTYNITVHNADDPLGEDIRLLCARAGMEKPPTVGLIENEHIFNAFAIGLTRQDALIAISAPLVTVLTQEERLAVLGHELGHVINRDMARMTFARSFQGALTWFLIFHRFKILARWLFTFVSEISIMSLSRSREYWADAMGAALTSPEAMIGALRKIEQNSSYSRLERRQAGIMFRAQAASLFATHPSTKERISALESQTYLRRLALRLTEDRPSPAASPIPGLFGANPLAGPSLGTEPSLRSQSQAQPLGAVQAGKAVRRAAKGVRALALSVRSNPWRSVAVALFVVFLFVERSIIVNSAVAVGNAASSTIDTVADWTFQRQKQDLVARERTVSARERSAADLETRLASRGSTLDTQERLLRDRDASLRNQQSDIEHRKTDVEARERAVTQRELATPTQNAEISRELAERVAAVEQRESAVYVRELNAAARERVGGAPSSAPAVSPSRTFAAVARTSNLQVYVNEKDTTSTGAEQKALAACSRSGRCEIVARLTSGENECFAVAYVPGRPFHWTGAGRTLNDAGEAAAGACEQRYVEDCKIDRSKNFCISQ